MIVTKRKKKVSGLQVLAVVKPVPVGLDNRRG